MNLFDFSKKFPNEEYCKQYLRTKREEEGVACRKCNCQKMYWINNQNLWRCSKCRSTINLQAGTIMERSHLPISKWFMAIHLMTSTKKAFSALEMRRQLGMKRYEPVWYMMQKIRSVMGKRDGKYKLQGIIEVDDAYFEIVNLPQLDELGNKIVEKVVVDKSNKAEGELKRGRGSSRQQRVLVMVESIPNPQQTKKHAKKRAMGFVKMIIMDDLKSTGIQYEVSKNIDSSSSVVTDKMKSFAGIGDVVAEHEYNKVPQKEASKVLPWVHTMISNAKRLFLGIHHSIGKEYLQNYLNEYCYKLNRRNFKSDLFDRMILAGVQDTWY